MDKELRNDLIAGVIFAIALVPGYFIWANSPTVQQEKTNQRQHAIEFLRLHQWDMHQDDIKEIMKVFHITWSELSPPSLADVENEAPFPSTPVP